MPHLHTIIVISLFIVALARLAPAQGEVTFAGLGFVAKVLAGLSGCINIQKDGVCDKYKNLGYCTNTEANGEYMGKSCKKTCGFCSDMNAVYRIHNDERRKIGKPSIKIDKALERIIQADASTNCRTKEGGYFPRDSGILDYCGKHYPTVTKDGELITSKRYGVVENMAFDDVESRALSLQEWISEKKSEHYENAFQKGKAVGCALKTNCPGSNPVRVSCVYCV